MAASPSKSDRADFAGFCRNATDSQLTFIVEKERAAGHRVYAQIARDEIIRRGAREQNQVRGTRRRAQRAEGGHALTLDPVKAAHWLFQQSSEGYRPSVTVAAYLKEDIEELARTHSSMGGERRRIMNRIYNILDAMRSSSGHNRPH